jgi:hypothetical protein
VEGLVLVLVALEVLILLAQVLVFQDRLMERGG